MMNHLKHISPADYVMHYRSQGMALTIGGRILREASAVNLIRRLNDTLDTGVFSAVAQNLLEITADQWDRIEIGLRLGFASHMVAVRVSAEKAEAWLELQSATGLGYSATVDAGDSFYVLFRCETEHCTVRGQIAEGITLLSEGDVIKLPPFIDSRGEHGCWLGEDPILPFPELLSELANGSCAA